MCGYQSVCREIASSTDSPTLCRFLVLPDGLSTWNLDPTTHQFRLYFLCDTVLDNTNKQPSLPQHKHLSNHPWYNLDRPQEFFQAFGSLTLALLKMVRRGASHYGNQIPPLDTFEILWKLEPEMTSHCITKDTIGSLVDKSISYLQGPPVAKCEVQFFWIMKNAAIKDFLVVPDGSNCLGELYQSSYPLNKQRWTCQQHGYQQLPPGALEALIDFVQGCGGHVDIQQASLSIELCFRHQAEQLYFLIKNTEQRMDISIALGWDLDELLRYLMDAKLYRVKLDGVTHNMHPKGNSEYRTDLIANRISNLEESGFETFLNHPQPQE